MHNLNLNISVYNFLAHFLPVVAFLPPDLIPELVPIVDRCIFDLEPDILPSSEAIPDYTSAPQTFSRTIERSQKHVAFMFLLAVIKHVPELPRGPRSRIDRHILLNDITTPIDEEIIAASVLYPGDKIRHSILPIAASKLGKTSMWMDCIMHPRLPPIQLATHERRVAVGIEEVEIIGGANGEEMQQQDEELEDEKSEVLSQDMIDTEKSWNAGPPVDHMKSPQVIQNSPEHSSSDDVEAVVVSKSAETAASDDFSVTEQKTILVDNREESEISLVETLISTNESVSSISKRLRNSTDISPKRQKMDSDVENDIDNQDDDEGDFEMPAIDIESSSDDE